MDIFDLIFLIINFIFLIVINDFEKFIKRYSSELDNFRNILEDIEYFDNYVQKELHEVQE